MLDDPDLVKASGAVLEGAIRLDGLFPAGWPASVFLAAALYATPDGGGLLAQVPGGDGDLDLEAPEYVEVPLGVSAVPPSPAAAAMRAWPNPFNAQVTLQLSGIPDGPVVVRIFDAAGRAQRTLAGQASAGVGVVRWDGRDDGGRPLPSGMYLAQGGEGRAAAVARILLVK